MALDGNALLEISDLVLRHSPSGERLPVRRDELARTLRAAGDRYGAWVARRLPLGSEGALDPDGVDQVLLRSHLQLQRLSEELQQGQRAAELLAPVLAVLRAHGMARPRVVDVGCGLGQVLRWLAWHRPLGEVELVGCDLNGVLIAAAAELAAAERLDCTFLAEDAFALAQPADIVISTGFVHHLRGHELTAALSRQHEAAVVVHWDVAPGPLTGLGALVFHVARMREPLARHDGVVSALRAHSDATLVAAVREALPGHVPALLDPNPRRNVLTAVLRPVLGIRADLLDAVEAGLPPSLQRRLEVHR
jgi:SAM-dependent methyltransferase